MIGRNPPFFSTTQADAPAKKSGILISDGGGNTTYLIPDRSKAEGATKMVRDLLAYGISRRFLPD
jgi:hypothetical protein